MNLLLYSLPYLSENVSKHLILLIRNMTMVQDYVGREPFTLLSLVYPIKVSGTIIPIRVSGPGQVFHSCTRGPGVLHQVAGCLYLWHSCLGSPMVVCPAGGVGDEADCGDGDGKVW